jgi:hypothetical protein
LPAGDYRHKRTVWLSPHVLPWVAAVAILAVFVLSFFSWVGLYPGGVGVLTQSGWQAGFGSYSLDSDVKDAEAMASRVLGAEGGKTEGPGASGLLILYLLLLIPALLLTIGAAVWPLLPLKLPPAVERLRPWRWGIAGGVSLLAFFLLLVAMLTGLGLENKVHATAEKAVAAEEKAATTPAAVKMVAIQRGERLASLRRTAAVCWVAWLHGIAALSALAVFWLERRGARPHPRIDLLW